MKESDLYDPIKKYYEELGYEVYSEVMKNNSMKRVDIVCKNDMDTIVIEMKTTLSFQLIDQIRYWKKYANFCYIAVPTTRTKRSQTALDILKIFGIGLIEIDFEKERLFVHSEPRRIMNVSEQNAFNNLQEEHQTWSKGGAPSSGNYVTTYKLLMNDVYKYLRLRQESDTEDEWVDLDDIVKYIQTNSREIVRNHYSNLRQGLYQSLNTWEVGDVMGLVYKRKKHYKIMEESTKYLEVE